MIPSELKLASLRHCYVHLPETFLAKEPSLKPGAIVSVRSVQNDIELCVLWNGQLSPANHAQLDLTFAQSNGFEDELIILSLATNIEQLDCSLCRVELIDSSDYTILSQHLDASLLDTCKLVSKNLVVPIYLSQNVKVLVKVLDFEPGLNFGILTKWTELQFQHSFDKAPPQKNSIETLDDNSSIIVQPIPLVSANLGVGHKSKFNLGSMLVCGEQGSGKTHFLKTTLHNYRIFNSELFNCGQLRGKRPENVKKKLCELLSNAIEKQPYILALDDIDSIVSSDSKNEDDKGQDVIYKRRVVDMFCYLFKQLERSENVNAGGGAQISIIATCNSFESLDPRLSKAKGRKYFSRIIKLPHPGIQDRIEVLKGIIGEHNQIRLSLDDNQLKEVAERCSSYMPRDMKPIVERSIISACSKALLNFDSNPIIIQPDDLLSALDDHIPSNLRRVALKPKTARNFSDVGGMRKIKEDLKKTIVLQIKYRKLHKKCPMKLQTSVLLYGPPGCGKTLVAEALTNQASINCICVNGPELLSKFIGASEAAVRDLFRRAELAKPCVIFFDEFESLVAKRGSDSTGVTDRVVNQFLTILDGVEKLSDDIFIIAATNRPDLIDPAILRPGRLDKHIYCPVPDKEARMDILKVLSRNIEIEDFEESSMAEWASKLDCFTGADIQSLLYSALLKALHEVIELKGVLDDDGKCRRHKSSKEDLAKLEIKVKQAHLEEAFDGMKTEVVGRYYNLLNQYPPSIRRSSQRVAVRATLA